MKKPNIDIKEAAILYRENGSLHKTAKLLNTSHIRLSNLFKENGIKIENVGKNRIITDDDIKMIEKLYQQGFTIQEISKELHITTKKVSKTIKSLGITTGRWHNYEKPIKVKQEKKVKQTRPQKNVLIVIGQQMILITIVIHMLNIYCIIIMLIWKNI